MTRSNYRLLAAIALLFFCVASHHCNGQDNSTENPLRATFDSTRTDTFNRPVLGSTSNLAPEKAMAQELTTQLSSPDFQIRQHAFEKLWRMGESGRPVLLMAANHPDPEVSRRASEILNDYRIGVDAQTPRETARIVKLFHSGSKRTQGGLLNNLARNNRFELLYRLLDQVSDREKQRELYRDVFGLKDFLTRLVQAGRWQEIEFMLTHQLTRKFDTMIYFYFQLAQGSARQLSKRLHQDLLALKRDGLEINDEQLMEMVSILRIERRFDDAMHQAQQLKDVSTRIAITRQVLKEKGDWKTIAENMILGDETPANGETKFAFNLAQQAVIHHFNNDEAKVKQTLSMLASRAGELKKGNQAIEAKAARRLVAEVALSVMDLQTAMKYFDSSDRLEIFAVLNHLHRYDDAFMAVDLSAGLDERIVWFERRIRNLESLRGKIQRQEKLNQDTDELEDDLRATWRLCTSVASQFGSWGFTQESRLHYRTLFASLEDDENVLGQKTDILEGLIDLGEFEEVWLLVERGFSESEHRLLMESIFEYKSAQSTFWYGVLKTRYPNAQQRLRVVASLINSPMGSGIQGGKFQFDLDEEFAAARSTLKSDTGILEFHISEVLKFHGRDSESQRYLFDAKGMSNRNATALIAAQFMNESKFEGAVSVFEESSTGSNSTFNLMQAAEAYRKLGRADEAALRETMAFVVWDNSYRSDTIINDFDRHQKLGQLADFLQVYVCAPGNKRISNERYRGSLASSLSKVDPKNAAINMQISLLEMHSTESPGLRRLISWADAPLQIMTANAKALIDRGAFDDALATLLKSNEFRPGDPGIGEEFLPAFAEAGKLEHADRLLTAVSDFYFEVLQRFPASPLHHNNFAWICACGKHQLSSAKRHSEKAISLRPQTSSYLDTYAEICYLIDDEEQAIEYARQCTQLNPQKLHYQKQLKRFQKNSKR